MKKIIFILSLIVSLTAGARTLKEIMQSGFIQVAVLNPEKDEFDSFKSLEKNKLINQFFENYTLKKFNKKITIQFTYVNKFSEFWTNQDGNIIKEKEYTPQLFKKVDAYFEFMSMSDWRVNKAQAIPMFKSNLSLICNFEQKNSDLHNIEQVMEVMFDKSVNFIAIKNTKLDNTLERLKIPKSRILYVSSRYGLVKGMLQKNKRECTLAETMLVLNMLTKGKVYFVGNVTPYRNRILAWWIEKNNIELNNFIQESIPSLKKSNEWNKMFSDLFGINYNLYNYIVNSYIE
ncbi:hypothetical protein [Fluviispira sanaruensis]|uniref:Solute-binding protein family 3/N-terminal domain-containing protein n=1 Tax=Fluviispira sanaruensis TaxID=2493639 RepID=A0A4P2VSB1_FLUSA|nr:hypothetical protein [Fluviispira sanaruensis]BBH51682.1 hypothetical protein JCM31447_00990 [Fluviispira sanaruensis]